MSPEQTPEIPTSILQALTRGATLVTPGQRQARTLRCAAEQHLRRQATGLFTPPPVFALETFLARLWSQLLTSGDEAALLLSPPQEHSLWHTVIAPTSTQAQSPHLLADLALRAYSTLCLHNGRTSLSEQTASTPDALALLGWMRHFERLCARGPYLAPAQLPAALTRALARGVLPVPDPGLALIDFDHLRPAHQQLFHSLELAGYPVQRLSSTLATSQTFLTSAPEAAAELRAAAAWARHQLALNPAARIAIVVPDLAPRRTAIERVFTEVLAPELQPITASAPPPFEFSLGTSLESSAFAAHALDLLRWCLSPLPLNRISALLLSPHLISATIPEALDLAAFDSESIRSGELLRPQRSLSEVAELARTSPYPAARALHRRLNDLHRLAPQLHEVPALHSHWAELFRNLLRAAGFAPTPDSLTFQLQRRWESTLDQLSTLDFNASLVPAATALDTLARLVHNSVFAPESRHAPVQILGPLELGAIPFDALWLLSADDASWPRPAAPAPLLPRHLQRELGLPGSDPALDQVAALALTRRIARSAPHVVFSYASVSDETSRRPSPLLREFTPEPLPSIATEPAAPQSLDTFPDTVPLPPLPDGVLRGGALVLERQAACPFRAFAEKRLLSAAPEAREPGLDTLERGSVVHDVMQLFWQRIQSQANLKALSSSERDAALDTCINDALKKHQPAAHSPWDHAYLAVERRRLHALLRPWLQLELNQPPFTVTDTEKQLPNVTIGPLQLNLRADRVDQVGDRIRILDYKTGAAELSQWQTDRPEKPQLPLYAIATQPPPDGLAFAILKPGKGATLKAFPADLGTRQSGTKPPKLLPFEAQLEEWHRVLTKLAEDFHHGNAPVTPRAYPKTCEHCDQRVLCRLDLTTVDDAYDEDEPFVEQETSAE